MSWRKQYKAAMLLGKVKKKNLALWKELSEIRNTNSQSNLINIFNKKRQDDFSNYLLDYQRRTAQQQAPSYVYSHWLEGVRESNISCLAGLMQGNQ